MFQDSQLVGGGKEERGSLGGLDPVSWDGDANERPGGEAAQLEELVNRERNAGRCRKARVEWDSSRVETETVLSSTSCFEARGWRAGTQTDLSLQVQSQQSRAVAKSSSSFDERCATLLARTTTSRSFYQNRESLQGVK
ncbi:MAG: hypothetical protein LQ339_000012 [Xanthoria mediterranea]|nr:MAG: hypothetical protein LQ339_000012 [Xanthoria mediterranea]